MPDFITVEQFRSYLAGAGLDKLFSIGGHRATTFINKRAESGNPIKSFLHASNSKQHPIVRKYKVAHVLAVARACNLEVTPPLPPKAVLKEYEVIQELQSQVTQLESKKRELIKGNEKLWPYKFSQDELPKIITNIGCDLPSISNILLNAQNIDNSCGIYFLIKGTEIVYVGQSVSVLRRIETHFSNKDFDSFSFLPCKKDMLDVVESLYIHLIEPKYNGNVFGSSGRKSAPVSRHNFMKLLLNDP